MVLHPIGQDYPGFFMEPNIQASCLILTLMTGYVPKYPNWDAGTLVGHPVPTHGMVPIPVSCETSRRDLNC